jgi:hypothetical protein
MFQAVAFERSLLDLWGDANRSQSQDGPSNGAPDYAECSVHIPQLSAEIAVLTRWGQRFPAHSDSERQELLSFVVIGRERLRS